MLSRKSHLEKFNALSKFILGKRVSSSRSGFRCFHLICRVYVKNWILKQSSDFPLNIGFWCSTSISYHKLNSFDLVKFHTNFVVILDSNNFTRKHKIFLHKILYGSLYTFFPSIEYFWTIGPRGLTLYLMQRLFPQKFSYTINLQAGQYFKILHKL